MHPPFFRAFLYYITKNRNVYSTFFTKTQNVFLCFFTKNNFFSFCILMIHMILVVFWRLACILFKNICEIAMIIVSYHFTYFVYFVSFFEQTFCLVHPQVHSDRYPHYIFKIRNNTQKIWYFCCLHLPPAK